MPQPLIIPSPVLGLSALSWPARLILAEILALQQADGFVHATDQHFVDRLPGLAKRTVVGAIKELVDGGFITRQTNHRAYHRRLIIPVTPLWKPAISNTGA